MALVFGWRGHGWLTTESSPAMRSFSGKRSQRVKMTGSCHSDAPRRTWLKPISSQSSCKCLGSRSWMRSASWLSGAVAVDHFISVVPAGNWFCDVRMAFDCFVAIHASPRSGVVEVKVLPEISPPDTRRKSMAWRPVLMKRLPRTVRSLSSGVLAAWLSD